MKCREKQETQQQTNSKLLIKKKYSILVLINFYNLHLLKADPG